MSASSITLTLLIGEERGRPAPRILLEALQDVEVTHSDEGRSGFQLVFRAGRTSLDVLDDPVVSAPELEVFTRVQLLVTISGSVHVLMDGVITHQQFAPSARPGGATFTVTGEDVSVLMDREEHQSEYPGTSAADRVAAILDKYAQHRVDAIIRGVSWDSADDPSEGVPTQQVSDYAYLMGLAEAHGCVFYVTSGPSPGRSTAYFGPPDRAGPPQERLSWNQGQASNVTSLSFQHNALKPTLVSSWYLDGTESRQVKTTASSAQPMSARPTATTHAASIRVVTGPRTDRTYDKAASRATEETTRSSDAAVVANGELDTLRYGSLLQARASVWLVGAGGSYDGNWYVQSVTHTIKRGEYRQGFVLERDGLGTLVGKVS